MQDTNLTVSPYFDDFDSSKNYQKILFKPGYSVQTRELNTLQSTFQNQIERFGSHIFKDGSVVIPGNVHYNMSAKCVLVQDTINGVSIESYRAGLVGKTLTGLVSGVKAEVIMTLSAEESEKDTITLYLRYNSGGNIVDTVQYSEFINNEALIDDNGDAVALTTVQNASSYIGSTCNIKAGVYYVRGYFVEVSPQLIILEQYSNRPSYKVGLAIEEAIINSEDDSTLFDNSIGSTNYASPGADRLQFKLVFSKQDLTFSDKANFIELLRFENGDITEEAAAYTSAYNQLEKNLARRTYSNHGSFTTQPYTIKIREALNDGVNGGVYYPNEVTWDGKTVVTEIPAGADPPVIGENAYTDGTSQYILGKDYYALELSEGRAYVEGFEVINERKQYTLVPKPRKTQQRNNQGVNLNIGSYFKLDLDNTGTPTSGTITFGEDLQLKDVDGTVIGTATALGLVRSFLYVTNVNIYKKLTLSSANNIASGDFITGSLSGATAFVDDVSGSTLTLRQVTGTFLISDSILSSRYTTDTDPTVSSILEYIIENVRTIDQSTGDFDAAIELDRVTITGSSFELDGDELTGIGTQFNFDLSAKSTITIPGVSGNLEVDEVDGTTVTLESDPSADGTYYSIDKLICKLYSGANGLTTKASLNPIKKTTITVNGDEESDYIHHRQIVETITTGSNGSVTIQSQDGTLIDPYSITLLSSTGNVEITSRNVEANHIVTLGTEQTSGTSVYAYYSLRLSNPSKRTKTKQSYQFLIVDKEKNSSNNMYGTRYTDKEISLKFPDVIKIHAIHEAVRESDTAQTMFDSLELNDASNITIGDIITSGTIRCRVISRSSNTVWVQYLSTNKFQSGTNLVIKVKVPTNETISGLYVKESTYGRYIDLTDDYKFVRNDTKDYYRVSKLVRKSSAAEPQNKIVVVFDYFRHTNLGNDFYTAESYSPLEYGDIPLAFNQSSMADLIDFRYYVTPSATGGSNGSGTATSPYKETKTDGSAFDIAVSTLPSSSKVPFPQSVFNLDYEFYMGRKDKVYLTVSNEKYGYITGKVNVIQGADSVEPVSKQDAGAGLLLATIDLPPYLKDVSQAKINLEKTRNYTMQDIGKLDERLNKVEEYTTLSLLEVNTNNLNILDENGNNRFKNGFVVDNFTTKNVANLQNPDYTASLDLTKNIVRPYPTVNNADLQYNDDLSDTNLASTYITIPYTEIPYAEQPYASRVENLFPYEVFSWVGNMTLFPQKDIWYDTDRTIVENQSINLVDAYTALFDLVVPGGQIWDGWQLGAGGSQSVSGGTNVTDINTGTQYDVGSLNFEIESGDTIQDIQDLRYSRSRVVTMGVSSLKPSTKMYFYINDTDSNNIIYPKLLNLESSTRNGTFAVGETVYMYPMYEGDEVTIRMIPLPLVATVVAATNYSQEVSSDFANGNYLSGHTKLGIDNIRNFEGSDINPTQLGSKFFITGATSNAYAQVHNTDIISSENGVVNAFVLIPPLQYETGEMQFNLSSQDQNTQIKGLTGSYATASYYSQGTELTVTSSITTLEAPELTATTITDERVRFIPNPPPPPGRHDPIAQSFFVSQISGVFATSIDLYFLTKDPSAPVTIDIRTVENGAISGQILPGSVVTVESADVKTSNDATAATRFTFPNPLYLSPNNDYAFIVRTVTDKYNMWVSRLGEEDVTTGLFIDKQPFVGVLYKSSNQSIWTPDQFEDVKFTLNRAQFDTNTVYTCVLENKPIEPQQLPKNPLSFTEGSSVIKVFQPNHGMHQAGNKVEINLVASDTTNATISSALSSNSVSNIQMLDISGTNTGFDLSSIEGWNKVNNATVAGGNKGFIKINDEIISYTGVTNNGQLSGITRGELGTTATAHDAGSVVRCFNVNGIPSNEINTEHTITNIISMDEYEITVTSAANATKQTGGTVATATRNIQYESIEPFINIFTPVESTKSISLGSTSGTSIGNNKQKSFITRRPENIENGIENVMNEPKLVLSEPNRKTFQNSQTSTLKTYITMSTPIDRVSPVVDVTGSSIVTISNRLNKVVDADGDLDISSELTPFGGKHSAYITKRVILETASTSIKVLFDAIRMPSVELKVFAKIKYDSSSGEFDDMNYIEVPVTNNPVSDNKNQFRAFDFEIKGLEEFQEFAIKVVMIGNDQSEPPKIRNFRALALAL